MDIIELGTGMQTRDVVLLDEEYPSIEVDWGFLRMVITRLRSLEKVDPNKLAEADIPRTVELIESLLDKVRPSQF
jgi:hypothetical protein